MSRTVLRLRIHPVKGARGFDVESMDFDETGAVPRPALDGGPWRRAVHLAAGHPALATVKAAVAGSDLILSAPGAEEVAVPVTPEGERIRVQVWDSVLTVPSVSPAADQWLSAVLGARRRLVHIGDDDVRRTDPAYAADRRVGFADGVSGASRLAGFGG